MKYFNDCKTIEEVKSLYENWLWKIIRTGGGDIATMQAINGEYAFARAFMIKRGGRCTD